MFCSVMEVSALRSGRDLKVALLKLPQLGSRLYEPPYLQSNATRPSEPQGNRLRLRRTRCWDGCMRRARPMIHSRHLLETVVVVGQGEG